MWPPQKFKMFTLYDIIFQIIQQLKSEKHWTEVTDSPWFLQYAVINFVSNTMNASLDQ
jgi:hypothetical protein